MAILNHIPKKTRELANNLETTIAGVAALDAAQGKVLKEFAERLFHVRWTEQGEQVNIDSMQLEGRFYAIGDSTKGTKPFGYGTLLHVKTTETDLAQLAFSTAENKLAIRYTNNGMIGWSTWSYVVMQETFENRPIYNQYTLTVDGDINTFYPVVFPECSEYLNIIELSKYVARPANNTGALRARFEYATSTWGGYPHFLKVAYHLRTQKDFIANAEIGRDAVYGLILWLRGATPYEITHNVNKGKATVYYERTDISYRPDYPHMVEPTTTIAEEYKEQKYPT